MKKGTQISYTRQLHFGKKEETTAKIVAIKKVTGGKVALLCNGDEFMIID